MVLFLFGFSAGNAMLACGYENRAFQAIFGCASIAGSVLNE